MTRQYTVLFFLMVTLVMTGCDKYLDVQPEDKYTEEQVYSSEKAIQQALNGLYFNLTSNDLYGASLTSTVVDIMGQRYWTTANGAQNSYNLQMYAYYNETVKSQGDMIWSAAYSTITKANKFISSLGDAVRSGVISRERADILEGEAIGIRAMLHFDLLRLFGPVIPLNPTASAIPYYRKADALPAAILPANEVIDNILADLNTSKQLLSADPIINNGVKAGNEFYSDSRNQRLNYYAVLALQARVFLYAGKKAEANQAAKDALNSGEKWFPWVPYTSVINNLVSDRIFSTEVLFGVYNQRMYTNYNSMFAPDLTQFNILIPFPARLKTIFGEAEGLLGKDYRYLSSFVPNGPRIGATQEISFTISKFSIAASTNYAWKYIQPLIRKSELYYIIAETETDPEAGLAYLNTVRFNRGLPDIGNSALLQDEIQKEYQKEFWGEGQMFFYYKRKAVAVIPSGVNTGTVSMSGSNAAKYVFPLPLSETTPR